MASIIILNSRKRGKSDDTEDAEISEELMALPTQPWEADMILGVLSGGR
jgi:hypothetical protein